MPGIDGRIERQWGGCNLTYLEALREAREGIVSVVAADEQWGYYDSSLDKYQAALPALGNRSLAGLVERPEGRPFVAVDLMASPAALRDLFRHLPADMPKVGFAVGLTDMRTSEEKRTDNAQNIQMLQHDLSYMAGWRGVSRDLGGLEVDLAMERAVGGLECLPQHPHFFSMAFNYVWGWLAVRGAAALELPFNSQLSKMGTNVKKIRRNLAAQAIEASVYYSWHDDGLHNSMVAIKTPGAPEMVRL